MIPKECKRLAEVDFPIAVVSRHAAREKFIRYGHPSTLHLWWARRPLAACRSILLALVLPDPADPRCPDGFKHKARELLPRAQGAVGPADDDLRRALLRFIGDFANWDLSTNASYLEVARGLVKAAHPEETPLVVDPFAGGGSIPLEGLRLGCDAFASDLNPVACLILKVMLEDVARHGPELADELRRASAEIKNQAHEELASFYPQDPDGATPIAYLWARTIRCEAPNCGAEIPLVRSFWLSKKTNRKRALRHKVLRPDGGAPTIEFEIFQPRNAREVPSGTVTRAKATCLACQAVLPPERVRAQLAAARGGADVDFDAEGNRTGGARLLAVVTIRSGEQGRHYRLASARDYEAVRKAHRRLASTLDDWERGGRRGLCPVPDEPTPAGGGSGAGRAFSVQRYGMMKFADLFTARQLTALITLRRLIAGLSTPAPAVKEIAALALSRFTDISNCLCQWESSKTQVRHLFTRQAIPMLWDFAEPSLFGDQAGDYTVTLETMIRVVEMLAGRLRPGQVQIADACASPLPDQSAAVWFTDPPYYDAVPYADLSDFFFVWLKRVLAGDAFVRDPFDPDNPLTPKAPEAVQDETREFDGQPRDRDFFEDAMARAFAEGRRVLSEDGIASVVFAHKTTEGWEALLTGLIRGGWTITGSWPLATESATRLRARDSAALATSVHLICRPRSQDAPVGDWRQVLRELPERVGSWMERLQSEGIRGADLVFACIGPALEVFSRYSVVETAEGREVDLPRYLEKVWEVVGRTALEQVLGSAEARARNGLAGALEEDARLTALFLWTVQSTSGQNGDDAGSDAGDEQDDTEEEGDGGRPRKRGYVLIYDVVRRFAQPLGIDLPKWEDRIIRTEKGIVRLLPLAERRKQLFGEEGARAAASQIERDPAAGLQHVLFPELEAEKTPKRQRRQGPSPVSVDLADLGNDPRRLTTTLDRVHAAMLLQASGQANALRALIRAEQDRGPDFLRLANALSALYPPGSEEKRLLDAMLLAVPR